VENGGTEKFEDAEEDDVAKGDVARKIAIDGRGRAS
jgi:hypothetical protein